jgi:hypothetical protein
MSESGISAETNIIDQLALLRFGTLSADSKVRLKRELKRYRRSSDAQISSPAIDNWFNDSGATPYKTGSIAFLHGYLIANIKPAPEHRDLYDSLESSLRPPKNRPHSRPVAHSLREGNLYVVGMINTILDRGRRSDRNEIDDFFYCSPDNTVISEKDHSFYVVYRYSTKARIVKEFLVCKRPQKDLSSSFSFLRFMRGDRNVLPELFRESEGVILKWETTYEFLGFNYRVSSDDTDEPAESVTRRMIAKSRPGGVELMAFEYDEIGVEHGLFSGLAMTVGALNQPIVARVAMLHLGTVGSLGRGISHQDVQPTVFDVNGLANDLRSSVSRLQKLGCNKFAPKLNNAVARSDWNDRGSARLAEEINTMLDNTPGWETSPTNQNRPKEPHGRGAIETFTRTGNRPRT